MDGFDIRVESLKGEPDMNPPPVNARMADGVGIVKNLLPHEIAFREDAFGKLI
jgi:hypothetical protein